MKKRMPTTKAQLIKAWYEAKSKEWADYIAFLFWEFFDEPISKYVC